MVAFKPPSRRLVSDQARLFLIRRRASNPRMNSGPTGPEPPPPPEPKLKLRFLCGTGLGAADGAVSGVGRFAGAGIPTLGATIGLADATWTSGCGPRPATALLR